MAAQGLIRATRDIDFFVSADPADVERLRRALFALYDDPKVAEITAEDLAGDYPAIEYSPPHGRYSMDIRSVEEMPGPAPRTPLDPENLKIAFDLMETTHRLARLRRRPGVRKFRSWNELLLARERE